MDSLKLPVIYCKYSMYPPLQRLNEYLILITTSNKRLKIGKGPEKDQSGFERLRKSEADWKKGNRSESESRAVGLSPVCALPGTLSLPCTP